MIYLDAAATTPVRREVLEAMWPFLTGEFGNPSSHHTLGEQAAAALKQARASVAEVFGCRASEIIFTSGGTEADNLAIKGIALANPRGRHIVTTPIEHEAVLACCDYLARHHGFSVVRMPVGPTGLVSPATFAASLHPDITLASVMIANNEVGTIEPIAELAEIAHEHAIPFHTDAVQAGGLFDLARLGVDALSLSGHKLGAPKGVGVLYLRSRIPVEAVLHGGGQERGRRSGTENVAAAVGFARALSLAVDERETHLATLTELRDRLIRGVLEAIPTAVLTGDPVARLPNHASFCFPGTSGEAVLLELERRGILCSSGSACAAGSDEPSHVLLALGLTREVAQTAVRFSLTDLVTQADVAETVTAVREACGALGYLRTRAAL